MPAIAITSLKDFDLAKDGSNTVLNFTDDQGGLVSLKFDFVGLERLSHELMLVLSKARQFALQSSGIVPILRPARCQAEIQNADPTSVVVSFQLHSGLELHYGIQSTVAEALAKQLLEKAEQGRRAKPPTRN
jgi:hypothetical protein